jgi:hypothetical protein
MKISININWKNALMVITIISVSACSTENIGLIQKDKNTNTTSIKPKDNKSARVESLFTYARLKGYSQVAGQQQVQATFELYWSEYATDDITLAVDNSNIYIYNVSSFVPDPYTQVTLSYNSTYHTVTASRASSLTDCTVRLTLTILASYSDNLLRHFNMYVENVSGNLSNGNNVTTAPGNEITVPSGDHLYTNCPIGVNVNPAAVTLTVDYQSGAYSLSTNQVIYNTKFGGCLVKGYSGTSCGGSVLDSDNIVYTSPGKGGTNFNVDMGGLTCSDRKYVVSNRITINGINCLGGTITYVTDPQGVTTAWNVVVRHTTCSPYPC